MKESVHEISVRWKLVRNQMSRNSLRCNLILAQAGVVNPNTELCGLPQTENSTIEKIIEIRRQRPQNNRLEAKLHKKIDRAMAEQQ